MEYMKLKKKDIKGNYKVELKTSLPRDYFYFSDGVGKVVSWEQPKWFGFIPKPRYINVYSRRLAKAMERFANKYF